MRNVYFDECDREKRRIEPVVPLKGSPRSPLDLYSVPSPHATNGDLTASLQARPRPLLVASLVAQWTLTRGLCEDAGGSDLMARGWGANEPTNQLLFVVVALKRCFV
jgi:hypothetical protein